ncbi:PREDICTED: chymotrypsin inhibitor-like [Dufourea novaeangliae]|uniref:chymotrypsin inhibitor-like n=1 Tax=Dufourea novaeangliae TaxID=178035 RepID=UPI000767461E|nr:PREDICTED: chymotrypsin inhibitor-like [Dufourea novaeangliae]
MSRFVFVFVLLAVVVAALPDDDKDEKKHRTDLHKCPPNEEWSLCGKICEPRCDNPTPKICPRIACSKNIAACRCKPGHLRNEKNRCVRPEKCKRHCKDHE